MGKKLKAKATTPALPGFDPAKKKVLHVRCGKPDAQKLHKHFKAAEWQEVRVDERKLYKPDIVSPMTSMPIVGTAEYDAVYSSHSLDRLFSHQVPLAMKEMYRVLKVGGFALLAVPDIQKIAEHVAQGKLEQALYNSGAGPIAAIDLIYGFRPVLADGDIAESHKTAFTARTLADKLRDAGFLSIKVTRDGMVLWALARKLAPGTELTIEIAEPDVNKMMQQRDELDKKPELPVALQEAAFNSGR
jgi:protein O-GlcNAc transferase